MPAETVVVRSAQDVVDFVDRSQTRSGSLAWMTVLVALGGTFIDAYDFTSLGIGAIQLRQQFHLSPAVLGAITSAMALGALIGALIGGYYTDKIGRFRMFLIV